MVHSNNQPDTPATRSALRNMGNGIVVYGGTNNVIVLNQVYDHERTGIGVFSRPEDDLNGAIPSANDDERPCHEARQDPPADPADVPDSLLWDARDDRVDGNVVSGSGVADLAVATLEDDGSALGNCFTDNEFASSAPARLEALAPCESQGSGDWSAGALDLAALLATDGRRRVTTWRPPVRHRSRTCPTPRAHPHGPPPTSHPNSTSTPSMSPRCSETHRLGARPSRHTLCQVTDDGFEHEAGGLALVFAVQPTKVLAFSKGATFRHTRHRPRGRSQAKLWDGSRSASGGV